MNIDNRLKRITDFIPSDSYILDVGCDHAFLDIYLALNRKNVKLIASDINENPLKKAQETNYLYISYIKQQKKLQTLNLNQEDFLKQLKKLEKDYQEKKVQANSLDYKQQTKEKLQNQIQETKQLINQIYQYQNDYQNLQTLKQQYRMLDEEHKLFLKKKEKFDVSHKSSRA